MTIIIIIALGIGYALGTKNKLIIIIITYNKISKQIARQHSFKQIGQSEDVSDPVFFSLIYKIIGYCFSYHVHVRRRSPKFGVDGPTPCDAAAWIAARQIW